MVKKSDKPDEGVLAQGRRLHEKIGELQASMENVVWPASPDDVVFMLVLDRDQHDKLKAYLVSKNMSFSGDGHQITSITGVRAKIALSSSIKTPDMFTKPKDR